MPTSPRPPAEPLRLILGLLRRVAWRKVGIFIISLFLFILALDLMRKGAQGLTPLLRERFHITSPINSLGFGWLFAYIIMSGSPVAASALTFFDAGIIDQMQTFTMITGSRLGSNFIVLFIGFVYVLRGRDRATSLSMGLLSLLVTATLHAGTLVLGTLLLTQGVLQGHSLGSGGVLNAVIDVLFDPVTAFLMGWLPRWGLFVVGMAIILVSFNLFDRCLPEMALKESQVGQVSRLVYRPIVMFGLGMLVTLISMSVSVSLSILVPLSQRGFVRRENVIPYIMGANVTTFIDTFFAALLLSQPLAADVVLAQMIGVTVMSLLVMLLILRRYERWMLAAAHWVTTDNRNLALFMLTIVGLPLLLMLI